MDCQYGRSLKQETNKLERQYVPKEGELLTFNVEITDLRKRERKGEKVIHLEEVDKVKPAVDG